MNQEQTLRENFPKSEKLKDKNSISLLFDKGRWLSCYPLKAKTLKIDSENQKVGFSVSKKLYKKAVDRNRIKRLLREAYRHNKDLYTKAFGKNSSTMFFYSSDEKPQSSEEVEKCFINLCNKMIE